MKAEKLKRTLIIFEFKDEIDFFISQNSINELKDRNTYILALMPESQAYLKEMGVWFFNTYTFFDRGGHERAVLQSDRISNFCKPFLTIKDDIGITEGYRNIFLLYMRCYINYLLWLIEIIERACIHWDIEKIIGFYRDNSHIAVPFLSFAEGYAAEIGARVAKKLNIQFESFQVPKSTQGLFIERLKKNAIEATKFIVYQIKFTFIKFLIRNKKIILTTSRSYNLGRVLDKFKQTFENTYVLYLNNKKGKGIERLLSALFSTGIIQLPNILIDKRRKIFHENLRSMASEIEASADCEGVFTFRKIIFKDLAFKRIREDIIPIICETYCQSVYLDKLLKEYPPTIVISQMASGINYNLGELASIMKIPSLLISHGSHVPPKNEYELIEWKEHGRGLINTHYQYIALQSPWAKAYLEKVPTRSTPIITGPLLFARIGLNGKDRDAHRKRLLRGREDRIILLHADTPRLRGSFRFYVYQTVDEYITNLNSLIKAVEKVEDLYLIIRFRPQYYLSEKQLSDLLIKSDCYSIHTSGTFEDYLSLSHMLISYSSTTIEEALQNKIPVILYDLHGKYCHIKGAEVLGSKHNPKVSSCYYIGSERDIDDSLNWLKKNHFSIKEPALNWNQHIFADNEKIELVSHFRSLFQ